MGTVLLSSKESRLWQVARDFGCFLSCLAFFFFPTARWWLVLGLQLSRIIPRCITQVSYISYMSMRTNKVITCFYWYHLFMIYKIRVTGEIRGRALHLCRYNVYGSASGFVYDFALIIVHSWHFSLKEPYWTLPMCLNLFYGFTRPWSECWLLVSQNHNKI